MLCKNRITLIGFLGQDAETRATPNATVYTRFSLATNVSWKEKESNEYKTRTEWHRVISWNKLAEWAGTLQKGAYIQVEGELRDGLSYMDVLKATFPAGTVSGAPKIRAIEIIRELEPMKRNIYAGAIGYIGWWGDADTAIAIRTAVIQDGRLHVQAGGGIVFDSDPAKEWEETMNKGRALFRAVAQAAGGL